MTHKTITIVSEINGDMQAWTFDIEAADFAALVEKYGHCGCSVRGTIRDIADDILFLGGEN